MSEWIRIIIDDDGNFVSEMPKDGENVQISLGDRVSMDTFYCDAEGGYFEYYDASTVDAWMPAPKPYWETVGVASIEVNR